MKKVLLPLISLALMGSVALNANAETKSPYTVDFNTAINTSDHGFKVASNWKHLAHLYSYWGDDYYMSYTYYADRGVDGSGTLYAGEQIAGDNYQSETAYDLLITPPVSGEISLKVKRGYTSSAFVQIWSVMQNENGTFKRVNKLTEITSDLSEDEWKTLSYTVADDTLRLGIRAQYAYLDDFSATSAEIEPEKGLSIVYLSPNPSTGTMVWDQRADKLTSKEFKLLLQNSGDVDFAPGDEGYSISLSRSWGDKTDIYTMPIEVPLAKGATSDTIIFEPEFDPAVIWSEQYYPRFNIKENITGSAIQLISAQYNKYEHKFVFRQKGSTTTSTSAPDPQNFGMISEPDSIVYEIYNDGNAPLPISSISNTGDFILIGAPEGAFTVAGKDTTEFIIAIPDTPGPHKSTISIAYTDNDGKEKTLDVAFSGVIISEGAWTADFNAETATVAYPAGSVAENGLSNDYNYISSPVRYYDHYLYGGSSTNILGQNKFITPKLHAQANDTFIFGVSRKGQSADDAGYVKVYLTTDRKTLGEPVATFNATSYEYNRCASFNNESITIPAEGDYYVAFELFNMAIDNLCGLQKVDVPHDMYTLKFALRNDVADTIQSGVTFYPEARIIPLTSAAKTDYALKYYLEKADGTKVAKELPSVDLTAASKGGTNFSGYSITHEVDATTEFTTYFAFEYTDGTVLTTPTRPLVITNEPKFHFIDKNAAIQNEPKDRDKAISFGKTSEFGKKLEFDIFNWGTAPLTVKSVTVPDAFATNIEGQTIVEGKAKLPVEISFVASEVGIYQGKLTIIYVGADGSDKTFELPVSATMLDPDKWYASFQKPKADGSGFEVHWPEGSLHQSNVSTAYNYQSGEFDIISYQNTDNLFTTPKLTAAAGEKFSFDARGNNSSVESVLKVVAATTREALEDPASRIELITLSNKDDEPAETKLITDQHQTFTVTFAEAGDYYIGFFLGNASAIDDLYGLTLTPVEADLLLKSTTIPATAMQNVASPITLEVLNLNYKGMSAKDYSFKLHVGDQVSDVAAIDSIPVAKTLKDTPVKVNAMMRSPKIGTFPVFVEVVSGTFKAFSDTVEVNFIPEVASSEKVIGVSNGVTGNYPLYMNYKNSQSINLFPAAMLGLTPGTKITSITVKGYKSSDAYDTDFELYYQWTDEQTMTKPAETGKYSTEGMTEYYNGSFHWDKKGSVAELADMIVMNFEEPLVYEEGKALKLLFRSSADAFKAASYEITATDGAYYTYEDGDKGTFSAAWREAKLPVLYMGLAVEPTTVSGKVSDPKGVAVEGATVTLVSTDGDNIQYEGTTDAEGKYSINVIQNTRHYDVTVTKDARTATAEDIDPKAQTEALNFVLLSYVDVKGKVTDAEGNAVEGAAITLTGSISWDVEPLVYTATSDAEGNFTIEGVREDLTYEATAEKDGAVDANWSYQPNADEALIFKLIRLVTVTGTVTDGTGAPIEGARVIFTNTADADDELWLMTDAEGKYSTEEVKEHCTYNVTVSYDGLTDSYEGFSPKLLQVLDFQLIRLVTVTGTVTDTTGAPMEGVRVIFANTADADDELWLMTDAEGKYSTEEVKEHCTYKVTASKDGITKTVESFDPKTTKVLDFQLTRVVTISDDTEGIAAGTDVTVKFELALEAGHNAIVLPMALTAEETGQIFGSDVEVYTYYDHKDNLARFLLSSDKALEAGVPYMIVSKQAAATATFTGKTLVAEPATVRGEKLHFTGTFAAKEAADGIFALTEDNFVADPTVATYAAAAAEDIKPFRAYITTDDNTVTSVSYTTSDFYSGIEGILVGTDEEPVIYNLHGVRVYNPTPGVYIVNGKKTLLK